MNDPIFRNMTPSEHERYAYLRGSSCVDVRAELEDSRDLVECAKERLDVAIDALRKAQHALKDDEPGTAETWIADAEHAVESAYEIVS